MTLLYNGVQYEIEEEGEIEQINIGGEEPDENDLMYETITEFRESSWEPMNVHVFLDECIRRKTDLRDPKVRRRRIFSEIRDQMRAKGYNFKIESLDRKLRNMKIHYLVTRENNKKSLKRTHWPYYDKMKVLYPEESSSSKRRLVHSLTKCDSNSSFVSTPPSINSSPPASPADYKIEMEDQGYTHESQGDDACVSFQNPGSELESLRRQVLAFEERRTVAAEKMLHELRESNRLKRESLELQIKLFKAERELEEDL